MWDCHLCGNPVNRVMFIRMVSLQNNVNMSIIDQNTSMYLWRQGDGGVYASRDAGND